MGEVLTVKKEWNFDRAAFDYHIYSNGRFYITCDNKKQAELFIKICKETK